MTFILLLLLKGLILILPLLLAVAFFTLLERKILAAVQARRGPNVVGFLGLLQPLVDGVKLILKESVFPTEANKALFFLAPVSTLLISLMAWLVIPFSDSVVFADINVGVFYLFACSSLGVYGIIVSGWASNSRYALLGALRSAAQMVSYEVSIGLIMLNILLVVGSLSLSEIVLFQEYVWFIVPFFPLFLMFFISIVAETNRAPFDLPEAEGELVAGYNVEYSGVGFAFFFIGEYSSIMLMSGFTCILFLGGWLPHIVIFGYDCGILFFTFKLLMLLFLFVGLRAILPRYRYDSLMQLGWKVFLPLSLAMVIFTSCFVFVFM